MKTLERTSEYLDWLTTHPPQQWSGIVLQAIRKNRGISEQALADKLNDNEQFHPRDWPKDNIDWSKVSAEEITQWEKADPSVPKPIDPYARNLRFDVMEALQATPDERAIFIAALLQDLNMARPVAGQIMRQPLATDLSKLPSPVPEGAAKSQLPNNPYWNADNPHAHAGLLFNAIHRRENLSKEKLGKAMGFGTSYQYQIAMIESGMRAVNIAELKTSVEGLGGHFTEADATYLAQLNAAPAKGPDGQHPPALPPEWLNKQPADQRVRLLIAACIAREVTPKGRMRMEDLAGEIGMSTVAVNAWTAESQKKGMHAQIVRIGNPGHKSLEKALHLSEQEVGMLTDALASLPQTAERTRQPRRTPTAYKPREPRDTSPKFIIERAPKPEVQPSPPPITDEDKTRAGQIVTRLREKRGVPLGQLAFDLEMDDNRLGQIEAGELPVTWQISDKMKQVLALDVGEAQELNDAAKRRRAWRHVETVQAGAIKRAERTDVGLIVPMPSELSPEPHAPSRRR